MRSSRYQVPNTLPPLDVAGVITIDQVRPQPRKLNEYVDTPRSPLIHAGKTGHPNFHCVTPKSVKVNLNPRERVVLPNRTSQSIIRTQPISVSPPLKKELQKEVSDNSIICSKCGKCRCGSCTKDQELPYKSVLSRANCSSLDEALEFCTCVCCVKGVFYHCSKEEQDVEFECMAEPCAGCSRPRCCERWTCILAMSLCLPCLCLYPPAKLCLMGCTSCYNKCRKKGCTCNTSASTNTKHSSRSNQSSKLADTQTRGLLVESDRESSSVS